MIFPYYSNWEQGAKPFSIPQSLQPSFFNHWLWHTDLTWNAGMLAGLEY
jgi:hypothetical protein